MRSQTVRKWSQPLGAACAAALLIFSVAGYIQAETPKKTAKTSAPAAALNYEVWAADQGTNKIHIIAPKTGESGTAFEERAVIDLGVHNIDMPHMIDFTSDYTYAFVANFQSGDVAVIRTGDRKVLDVIKTGHMTHMAAVLPDDSAAIVDVMHEEGALLEIVIDRKNERFSLGRKLVIAEAPLFQARAKEFSGSSPVCHDYTADGKYAYVTLGPALSNGGLLIFDVEAFQLTKVYPVSELSVNCGTMRSPDGTKMYLNGGSMDAGHWYVFNTRTHEPIPDKNGEVRRSSRGTDAHGVWPTPNGSELWMVNRATSNAIVIDPRTDEIIAEIAHVGPSPDIMTISPDNRYVFITLRGPQPRSGPHAIAGTRPGISIVDVATREIVTILEPAKGVEESDFHGIGLVRR